MKQLSLAVLAGSLFLGACTLPGMSAAPKEEVMMVEENPAITIITLNEQNGLGQSGEARLSESADGKVEVVLSMTGETFMDPQPAHIHVGSCPNPGAVQYPLTNVVDGQSMTTLDVTMDELYASSETLAINVHKSAAESKVYTACGDVQ